MRGVALAGAALASEARSGQDAGPDTTRGRAAVDRRLVIVVIVLGAVGVLAVLLARSVSYPVYTDISASAAPDARPDLSLRPSPGLPDAAAPTVERSASPGADAAVAPAGVGAIRGTVRLAGKAPEMPRLNRGADPYCAATPAIDEEVLVDAGRLANVVVRIVRGVQKPAAAKGPDVAIDQLQCLYRPRVSAVVAGSVLMIRNGDKTLHNVHAYLGPKTVFNRAQPPGMPPIKYTAAAGGALITLRCDVHPWMRAFVFVNEDPHVAVTGKDGAFQLAGVPAGTFGLEAWHEKFGTKTAEVSVAPDGEATVDFTFGG